jgi:hypothetical protein
MAGEQRSRRNLVLALGAIAVAALALVLVIVLSGDDGGGKKNSGPVATAPSGTTTGTTKKSGRRARNRGRRSGTGGTSPAQQERDRQPTGQIRQRVARAGGETIRLEDGRPVDGLVRLIYRHGDLVQLRVVTNRSVRVVIPTLGLSELASPTRGAEFSFPATQPGLHGVEVRRGGARSRIAVLAIH